MSAPADPDVPPHGSVPREWFGNLADGRVVEILTLTNRSGMQVRFLTLGGIIVSINTPDRQGTFGDVALGFDTVDEYLRNGFYFGALIGRCANRIAKARFAIDGHEYQLEMNDGANHLHGGTDGFHQAIWHVEAFVGERESGAELTLTSPEGDGGYPGNLRVHVRYTLTDDDELIVDYAATSDRATPVNLTQHSYFNLAGHDRGNVLDHELMIDASRFTPVDGQLIPTGDLCDVANTPFDFRRPRGIGEHIADDDEQLMLADGYDHNWVLDRAPDDPPSLAARLYEPVSGRVLEILTTEPGLHLYSANGFGRIVGKEWRVYGRRSAVALETQHFPDSPNQPSFPSTILEPGHEFRSRTVYRFSVHAADRPEPATDGKLHATITVR